MHSITFNRSFFSPCMVRFWNHVGVVTLLSSFLQVSFHLSATVELNKPWRGAVGSASLIGHIGRAIRFSSVQLQLG